MIRNTAGQMVAAILMLVAVTLMAGPIFRGVENRMEGLKQGLLLEFKEKRGVEVSYGSISPAFINQLEIHDLYSWSPSTGTRFQAENLVIQFSVWKYLISGSWNEALVRIELDQAEIHIRSVSGMSPANRRIQTDPLKDLQGRLQGVLSQMARDFVFEGRHLNLHYQYPRGAVRAENLFPRITASGEKVSFRGTGDILYQYPYSLDSASDSLSSHVIWGGDWQRDLEKGNLRLSLKDLETPWISAKEISTYLVKDEKNISLYKVKDSLPVDFHVVYREEAEDVSFFMEAEQFSPGSLVQFSEELSQWSFLAESRIDGSLQVLMPLAQPAQWRGQGDLGFSFYYPDWQTPVNGHFQGEGNLRDMAVEGLQLNTRFGKLGYRGSLSLAPFRPRGTLDLNAVHMPGSPEFTGRIEADSRERTIYLSSANPVLGAQRWDELHVEMELKKKNWIMHSSIKMGGKKEKGSTVDFQARGGYQGPQDLREAALRIGGLRVSQVISMLPSSLRKSYSQTGQALSPWMIDTRIQFQGKSDGDDWLAAIRDVTIRHEAEKNKRMVLSGLAEKNNLHMKKVSLQWEDYYLEGGFQGEWEDRDNFRMKTAFNLQDIPYHIEVAMEGGEYLEVQGDYNLAGSLRIGNHRKTGRISVESLPLPFTAGMGNLSMSASLDSSLQYGLTWGLRLLEAETPWGRLTASGQGDHRSVFFDRLQWQDEVSRISGQGAFRVPLSWAAGIQQQTGQGWIAAADEEGQERYQLFTEWKQGIQETQILADQGRLARFSAEGMEISGFGSADVRVSGPLNRLRVQGNTRSREASVRGETVAWEGSFWGSPGEVRISKMNLQYGDFHFREMSASVQSAESRVQIEGLLVNQTPQMSLSTRFSGVIQGDQRGASQALFGFMEGTYTGKLVLEDYSFQDSPPRSYQIDIMKYGGVVAFSEKRSEMISGYFSSSGDVGLYLNAPFPLQANISGRIAEKQMDVLASNISVDLPFLNSFLSPEEKMKNKLISFRKGKMVGQLHIRGQVSDPDFFGNLRLYNVQMGSHFVQGITEGFSTAVVFKGKEAQLLPVVASVGGSKIRLAGRIGLFKGRVESSKFSLGIQGGRPLPAKVAMESIAAEGGILGDIEMAFGQDNVYSRMDLSLYDTTVVLGNPEMKPPPEKEKQSQTAFESDITLRVQQGVEVLYPSRRLKVLRAAVKPGDVVKIESHSLEKTFSMEGELNIRNGEINYFNRVFRLREGAIFFNENQDKFNPLVKMEAELKQKDRMGEDVTVVMNINSPLFDDFSPRFTSEPLLPRDELAAILGSSVLPFDAETEFDRDTLILATSNAFTRYGIIQPFEYRIREALGLDFVSIETELVENIIENRLLSEDEVVLEDENAAAGDTDASEGQEKNMTAAYLNNTSISLGKYLGEGLFLEGGIEMGYNEEMMMVPGAAFQDQFDFQTHMKIQMDTPLFGLEWGISPSDWDNLFVNDQVLSFTWHITY